MKKIIFGFLILFTINAHAQSDATKVKIANGIVRGIIYGESSVFKGIPYAAAPIGEFRSASLFPATQTDFGHC